MMLDSRLWSAPVAIAHRGSRLLWPENTMEAFAGAIDHGYDHIETDLHITSDGVLVCIHDHTVDRTTDGTGPVDGLTFEEISSLDAGFRHATEEGFVFRSQGLRVPAFEEVVNAFPETRFVVELKREGLETALATVIEDHRLHDRVIVGSFSDRAVARFRAITRGRVATSTGRNVSRLWIAASRLRRRGLGRPAALQLPVQTRGVRTVDERLIEVAHASGAQVHVWTVNRVEDMERFLDMGVDGIVTDRPDLLKSVLTERGVWKGR